MEIDIRLTTDVWVTSKPYPVPYAVREAMKSEVQDMINHVWASLSIAVLLTAHLSSEFPKRMEW